MWIERRPRHDRYAFPNATAYACRPSVTNMRGLNPATQRAAFSRLVALYAIFSVDTSQDSTNRVVVSMTVNSQ